MKQAFTILFSLLVGLTTFCQKDNKAIDSFRYLRNIGIIENRPKDSAKSKDIQLTGRIKYKVQLTPACGLFAWGTVVDFEVIKLEGMTYPNKEMWVIVMCPDNYGNGFFQKGQMYQVVFSKTYAASLIGTIWNRDFLKNNQLSFEPYALSIHKIP